MLQKNKQIKDYNSNWPQLSDYPYRLLTIGDSGFGKINQLYNLITNHTQIDKIYLLFICISKEVKYQLLIGK